MGRKTEIRAGVYFIRAKREGGAIKTGYTTGLRNRLAELRSSCPDEIEVLGFWDGATRDDEAALHARFADYHVRGEWYADHPGLREEIAQHPDISKGSAKVYKTPKRTIGRRTRLAGVVLGEGGDDTYPARDGWVLVLRNGGGSVYVRDHVAPRMRLVVALEELAKVGRSLAA